MSSEPNTPSGAPAPAGALGAHARAAVAWAAGFQLGWDLVQFGVTLVLVRLLAPEAYGQFALVGAVIGFLTMVSFREVLAHTLQVRGDAGVRFQDHFTAGLAIQTGMFLAANGVGWAMGRVDAYAPVAPVIHVMSVSFLLDLPCQVRVKMLERALDWRRLRLLHGLGIAAGAALSLAMAAAGAGVYALVLPALAVHVVFTWDLFVHARFRPDWSWSRERYRPAVRFGATRIAGASLASGAQMAETAWLAPVIGFTALGLFGRAVALSQLVCQRGVFVLTSSLYPVLTKFEVRSDGFRRAAGLLLRSVGWTVVPAGVLLSVLALPVVRLIYGSQWLDAARLVPFAFAAVAIAALAHAAYTLLLAHDRQDLCLRADGIRFGGTVGALAAALPFGLAAYLAALAGVHALLLALNLRWLSRDGGLAAGAIPAALVPPAVSAATALAVVEAGWRLGGLGSPAGTAALAYAALFAGVCAAVLRLGFATGLGELLRYLPMRDRLHRILRLQPAA